MHDASWTRRLGVLAGFALAAAVWCHDQPDSAAAPPELRVAGPERPEPPPSVALPARKNPSSFTDAPLPPMLVGDAALRGALDLSRATLEGDRYAVVLGNGRKALLTLDPGLQEVAESVLERAQVPYGAVVVMATDGRLLALAGRAEADARPRDFALPLKVWAPAASVFKIVTAAALVGLGVTPDRKVCYHGGLRSIETSNLADDPTHDRDCHDLAYGVAKSQNAIIAKLVTKHLQPPQLQRMAARFGFDSSPEFALTAETCRANIPSDPLAFARVAAGFWDTELSPLGGALLANVIASGGLQVTPRVVDEIVDTDGASCPVVGVAPTRAVGTEVAARVAEMMVGTVDYGTARMGFHDPRGRRFMGEVSVAGKTGSLIRTDPDYLEYSWFVGFAPANAPQLSIAVLLGNPPKWHLKAHTAARLVLDQAL